MTTTVRIEDKAINHTYTGVTGATSGSGTGGLFNVTKTDGVYTAVITNTGTGYVAGDTITILGTSLGGAVANYLILTVASTIGTGAIATFGKVGTGRVGDGVVDIIIDVDGTDDVDTYVFQGDSTDFTLNVNNDGIVATSTLLPNVEFNLAQHERVVFDDTAIAFDVVDGAAGDVYSLLAAALGVTDVTSYGMGAALYYKDQGLSNKELAKLIVNSNAFAVDANGYSNESFVKNVVLNVAGRAATLAETAYFVGVLERGSQTKADLLVMASNVEDFQTTINLVGIQTTGIEYTPFEI